MEYFSMLLCELKIYLQQVRGDCGKTKQDVLACLLRFVLIKLSALLWLNKAINLILVQ